MEGNARLLKRDGEAWPSKVLHDVRGCIEGGLNRARLRALADYIEGLRLCRLGDEEDSSGPMPTIQRTTGSVACIGFVLRAGGPGYGFLQYSAPAPDGKIVGYRLTGYGLACWAWGESAGMSALASNGHVNGLQAVLAAEPVRRGEVPDLSNWAITTAHVAEAIRAFVECEDAVEAWRTVARAEVPAPRPVAVEHPPARAERPADRPALVAVPAPAADVDEEAPVDADEADEERFKTLFVADSFDEAQSLAERKAVELEAEAARLVEEADRRAEEAATWRKRLAAVRAMR